MPGIIWPQVTTDHEIIQLPCPLMLYLYNGILEKTIVEMSETDPPNHFSRIIQWPQKFIFGILRPFFHCYIFCHVVVSKVTSLTYLLNFFIHNIGVYKKCTLYKIPSMSSFFAPSTNETPFPNLQPRSENVQEYKRAKKSPGFPPSSISQMSLWARKIWGCSAPEYRV